MRNSGQTEVGLETNNLTITTRLFGGRSPKRRFVYCQSKRQYANLGVVYSPFGRIY